MVADDRRKFQRLELQKPILATMRGQNALILDIGMAGALVEHYGEAQHGDRFPLVFRWHGEDVPLDCEVVRSTVSRPVGGDGQSIVSHTGVRFIDPTGGAADRLQDLIVTFVGRILSAQKANAAGELGRSAGETILATLGEARRARTRGFVTYRLKDNTTWWRIPAEGPEQPADGFTVAAWEDEDELEALCDTYKAADEEGRRLIRMVAELSVHNARR
jgi:hypothetical protein